MIFGMTYRKFTIKFFYTSGAIAVLALIIFYFFEFDTIALTESERADSFYKFLYGLGRNVRDLVCLFAIGLYSSPDLIGLVKLTNRSLPYRVLVFILFFIVNTGFAWILRFALLVKASAYFSSTLFSLVWALNIIFTAFCLFDSDMFSYAVKVRWTASFIGGKDEEEI